LKRRHQLGHTGSGGGAWALSCTEDCAYRRWAKWLRYSARTRTTRPYHLDTPGLRAERGIWAALRTVRTADGRSGFAIVQGRAQRVPTIWGAPGPGGGAWALSRTEDCADHRRWAKWLRYSSRTRATRPYHLDAPGPGGRTWALNRTEDCADHRRWAKWLRYSSRTRATRPYHLGRFELHRGLRGPPLFHSSLVSLVRPSFFVIFSLFSAPLTKFNKVELRVTNYDLRMTSYLKLR
jgi:hypothetical protein